LITLLLQVVQAGVVLGLLAVAQVDFVAQ